MSLVVDASLFKLREEYTQKVDSLRTLLLDLEQINNEILPELRRKYDILFHSLEIDIQLLTLEVSQSQRVNELLLIKYQRGEEITPKVVEFVLMFVDKEYSKYKNKENNTSFGLQQSSTTISSTSTETAQELSRLYKELVKRLHPDSHQKDAKLYEQFWHLVQDSFEKKNLKKLRTYHSIVCTQQLSPDMFLTTDSEKERLLLEISTLDRRFQYEQKKLSSVQSNEPYIYLHLLDNDEWIEKHSSQLVKTIEALQLEVEQAKKVFSNLTKGITNDKNEMNNSLNKNNTFEKNFTDSTYFGGR